jgi:hypothetical protein
VFARPAYGGLAVAVALAVALLYSIVLPYSFTQRLSTANWRYLTAEQAWFAAGLGLLTAVVVTLQVHATRVAVRGRGRGLTAVGLAGSVLPSLLCCTPVVPTLLALAGVSATTIFATSGRIQGFFALNATAFLAGGMVLLAVSAAWTARVIATAACAAESGCRT